MIFFASTEFVVVLPAADITTCFTVDNPLPDDDIALEPPASFTLQIVDVEPDPFRVVIGQITVTVFVIDDDGIHRARARVRARARARARARG